MARTQVEEQEVKRREKERRKRFRQLAQFDFEVNAKLTYLMVKEMERERRVTNKALKMARRRKVNYIQ